MKGERSAIAALTGSNEEEQECTCSNDVHITGIVAAPMTYMVDDVQYITIAVGWGGVYGMWNQNTKQINPGTVYTFGLGKKASKPTFPLKPEKSIVELRSLDLRRRLHMVVHSPTNTAVSAIPLMAVERSPISPSPLPRHLMHSRTSLRVANTSPRGCPNLMIGCRNKM